VASVEGTVYLDASALVKLVIDEPESDALRRYVRGGHVVVTSEIAMVEVRRAVRLSNPSSQTSEDTRALLDEAWLVELDVGLMEQAALIGPPRLRTVDAIHLATALQIEPDEFLAYDHPLLAAAAAAGLSVASPGA
jgi:predicted nucleic acid-binding protein